MLAQFLKHLQTNKLLYHPHSAYRSDDSTETALLKICSDILSALDNKNVALLSLLDLSAAFDTIGHSILLSRLQTCFGIPGSVLSWFESYFSGRFQSVSVHETLSTPSPLLNGVPRGSVLGPILFFLYTYPLFTIANTHLLSHHSFSDDNQLYITGSASEISNLVSSTQSCISQLKSWMNVNKLKLNEDKTEMILISSPKSNLTLPSSVDFNGCSITISSSVRNHGFTFDQSLSFRQHVANVCRLCYLEIHRISSVRHLLSDDATKTLLCAFVVSLWNTVMLCLLVLQNTSLKNSRKFRIMLLDSSSVAPNLIMSPLSFIACTGSLSIWELTTWFLLSVSKFWNQLRPLTSLISYMFTLPPDPPPAASFFIWWSTFLCSSHQTKVVWSTLFCLSGS